MNLADYINQAPKKAKAAKKKPTQKAESKPVIKEVIKPISPIVKVIEQPNYSPAIEKQMTMNTLLADQAIASMRDTVNNNQAIISEIAGKIGKRPKEFIIQRDNMNNITKVIPVYEELKC